MLEDPNLDGTPDTFVRDEDLVAPLVFVVIGNQAYVLCAPTILMYTDVNRNALLDPEVDTKEVFLGGFRGLYPGHSS